MSEKALNIGFIGAGQCGGNIVNIFARRGYQTMAINTAKSDLDNLTNIPQENRILIRCGNLDGAGANPEIGYKGLMEHGEEVLEQMKNVFSDDIDMIYVCAGLGRGSGSGIAPAMLSLLTADEEQREEEGLKKRGVGAIVTYPAENESPRIKIIANKSFTEITQIDGVGSTIVIDNNKRDKNASVKEQYDEINKRIAEELCSINRLAAIPSEVAYDARDFLTALLYPGNMALFTVEIDQLDQDLEMNILQKLEQTYKKSVNLETEFDHAYGCAFLFEIPKTTKDIVTESLISKMKNVFGNPFEDYYGIYEKDGRNNPKAKIHIVLYGMPYPQERILKDEQMLQENAQHYQELQTKTQTQVFAGQGQNLFNNLIGEKKKKKQPVTNPFSDLEFGSVETSKKPRGAKDLLSQMKKQVK